MVPSAVTAKEIVIVLSFRTNGSSPPAALATAARIVSMASTRKSSRAPSRVSARSFSPGGVRLNPAYPAALDLIDQIDRTGMLPPLHEGGFTAFCHRPAELRRRSGKPGWRSWTS